jgi:AcrR family transcriptional regulator
VGRWQPDARGRLQQAALELYSEKGFDQTTVAEIAERAGLTERTFFRHFADKREVLFAGSELMQSSLMKAMEQSPATAAPIDQVAAGLVAASDVFLDRDYSRRRQEVISAHADLRERELIKLASLSAAFAEGLRRRGVSEPAATLSADAGVAIFKVAFEQWIAEGNDRSFAELVSASLAELKAVTASG